MRVRTESTEFDTDDVLAAIPVEIDRIVIILSDAVLDFTGRDADLVYTVCEDNQLFEDQEETQDRKLAELAEKDAQPVTLQDLKTEQLSPTITRITPVSTVKVDEVVHTDTNVG